MFAYTSFMSWGGKYVVLPIIQGISKKWFHMNADEVMVFQVSCLSILCYEIGFWATL